MTTALNHLFEPGKIGTLTLKNRLVMAAMGNFSTDPVGYIADRALDFYAERAKGGVGLIISAATAPVYEARVPYSPSLYDDKFIPRFQQMAKAVHDQGGKMAIQLLHAGRAIAAFRLGFQDPEMERGMEIIAPSQMPWPADRSLAREATKEDIDRIVSGYAEAARRVKDAGFDAVEFHGAHGYLISSFLSGYTNKRTDEYGGSPENRARFACEILRRTREKVGPDFPIIMRMSGSDYLKGGITIEDTLVQAPLIVKAGADALHISASGLETTQWQFLCHLWPDGAIVHLAEAVKKVVNVPVITVGKIGDPVLANRIIEEGKADFVAMGRPLLADPDLPNKAKEGRLDDIRRCIYCNNCCIFFVERLKYGGMQCTVNPALNREREFALKPATTRKNVMVVGGGLAGMEAAQVLAERGHHVTLYEKADKLGGQWNVACMQEGKDINYTRLTRHLLNGLEKSGAKIVLNREVDSQLVRQTKPDALVVATGAVPKSLNVPGIQRSSVVHANDVIQKKATTGRKVLVVGGRLMGMEVADSLAQQGKTVYLITLKELGQNGRPVQRDLYRTVRDNMIKHGVHIFPGTPLAEVVDGGAYVFHNGHLLFFEVDTVVLAVGVDPENRLAGELKGLVKELYMIGDCREPRNALDAVRDGAEIARKI